MIDLSTYAECKIDDIVTNLYRRVCEEKEKILKSQLEILGVDTQKCIDEKKQIDGLVFCSNGFTNPMILESWYYNNTPILAIKIGENMMSIEFDIPKLETQGGSSD
jgi:hypothetical protein